MNTCRRLDELLIHAATRNCYKLITKLLDRNAHRNYLFVIGCLLYLITANVQSEAVKQNTKLSNYYGAYGRRRDVRHHSNERLLSRLRILDISEPNRAYGTPQHDATQGKLTRQRLTARFKRNSERQHSNVLKWPHSCRIHNKHFKAKKDSIVYECTPSLLYIEALTENIEPLKSHPAAPSEDIPHEQIFSTKSTNLTNTASPDSTVHTRSIQSEDYALSDVTVQFEVPDYVTELRLWYQGIVSLEPNAFKKIRSTLAVVKMQHNQISYIATHAFSGTFYDF